MEYLLLFVALVLNALANVLLKAGAAGLGGWDGPGLLGRVLGSPYLLMGLALFALNVVCYVAALTRLKLSVAYPVMVAGGLVAVVLGAALWLKEPVTAMQWSGVALLVLGIVLVTRGAPA